ncbi:uncharacterized protein K460DRAFT_410280 [Cucurbitaria berberidis CBS 394.84]|uniref:Uncharacterized protein n=1 Tax=Cucurbitaria berberidis CBS 394.84 TaxID=1168544 RepID=A0A9P4G8B2_9PLEO|nr:uncharacterized protein K460DRAFT_410280 [Cucurbitaria berberidis CBS 394.84]KAF1840886.1 hypothetical protein K460DRAFT_410280 [Cucurbitaria berberidis CBS 394.84]
MATSGDGSSSRPDWHLVYTEKHVDGTHRLAIQIDGSILKTLFRHSFFLEQQSGTVQHRLSRYSRHQVVKEHGWFKDIDTFTHVCLNQNIPAQATPENLEEEIEIFDLWRSAVLVTLATSHQTLWAPNDGNTI